MLIHREQDLPLFTRTDVVGTGGPTSLSQEPGSSREGLSTAARAGIGVGVAAAVILVGVGFWLFLRRARAKRLAARNAELSGPYTGKPELDANGFVTGTAQKDDKSGVNKLSNDGALFISPEPQELPGFGDGHDAPWTLHPGFQPTTQSAAATVVFGQNNGENGPVELAGQSGSDGPEDLSHQVYQAPGTENLVTSTLAVVPTPSLEPTTASSPGARPSDDRNRAQRLLELQREQERLNAEADRVRHLMELEAQQRRIEDEIRGLRAQCPDS